MHFNYLYLLPSNFTQKKAFQRFLKEFSEKDIHIVVHNNILQIKSQETIPYLILTEKTIEAFNIFCSDLIYFI